MDIAFSQSAPAGEVFAPDAFDSQIGKVIPVRLPNGERSGRLTGAVVAPDGRSAELKVQLDVELPNREQSPGSFGFR
jgi:hypothetical protein